MGDLLVFISRCHYFYLTHLNEIITSCSFIFYLLELFLTSTVGLGTTPTAVSSGCSVELEVNATGRDRPNGLISKFNKREERVPPSLHHRQKLPQIFYGVPLYSENKRGKNMKNFLEHPTHRSSICPTMCLWT
jgi:hypothetical protein